MTVFFRILIAGSLLATVASTLSVYPHQLAYFNEAAGGPENGHKHLLHSNLDWGQDLLLIRELADDRDFSSYVGQGIIVMAEGAATAQHLFPELRVCLPSDLCMERVYVSNSGLFVASMRQISELERVEDCQISSCVLDKCRKLRVGVQAMFIVSKCKCFNTN